MVLINEATNVVFLNIFKTFSFYRPATLTRDFQSFIQSFQAYIYISPI